MPQVPLSRRTELAIAVESTPGTAETMDFDGSESKFLTYDLQFSPEISLFVREYSKRNFSKVGQLPGTRAGMISFRIEARRTNSTHTPDDWGKLLRATGWKETLNSGVDVRYTPCSNAPGGSGTTGVTLTAYVVIDGLVKFGLKGAMGNSSISAVVGEPPFMAFDLKGILITPSAQAFSSSITHETGIPYVFQDVSLNVGASDAFVINSLTLDMNNTFDTRPNANDASGLAHCVITDRDPKITIDPELVDPSTKNWISSMLDNTQSNREVAIGTRLDGPNGNLKLSIPKAQITGYENQDRNGVAVSSITLDPLQEGDVGDDEFTLICT